MSAGLMIAFGNQICTVAEDFSVMPHKNFWAIGSGARLALGSLATTEKFLDYDTERRVRTALEVAERFENTVGAPFVIESTKALPLPAKNHSIW